MAKDQFNQNVLETCRRLAVSSLFLFLCTYTAFITIRTKTQPNVFVKKCKGVQHKVSDTNFACLLQKSDIQAAFSAVQLNISHTKCNFFGDRYTY